MNAKAVRWIRSYGVARLVRGLERIEGFAITRPAVYQWLSGRSAPQARRAYALARLSRGALTLEDVFASAGERKPSPRSPAPEAASTIAPGSRLDTAPDSGHGGRR